MSFFKKNSGFTLFELLIVMAILGTVTSILFLLVSEARQDGRDANRASQAQELLKAFELYYTDTGVYPDTDGEIVPLLNPDAGFGVDPGAELASSPYIQEIPIDPIYDASEAYLYCSGGSNDSYYLYVNIEDDGDAEQWCNIERGYVDATCESATDGDARYSTACSF